MNQDVKHYKKSYRTKDDVIIPITQITVLRTEPERTVVDQVRKSGDLSPYMPQYKNTGKFFIRIDTIDGGGYYLTDALEPEELERQLRLFRKHFWPE